jgi:hypothetical protein
MKNLHFLSAIIFTLNGLFRRIGGLREILIDNGLDFISGELIFGKKRGGS